MVWKKKGGSSDPYYFYTGIIEDAIDGISGYDQVSRYTIKELEDALRGKKTWNDWRDNIKNNYNNAAKNSLDNLFDHWGH